MPSIGDKVRFTYRDGRKIEGLLIRMWTQVLWIYVAVQDKNGKETSVCINDEDANCLETI